MQYSLGNTLSPPLATEFFMGTIVFIGGLSTYYFSSILSTKLSFRLLLTLTYMLSINGQFMIFSYSPSSIAWAIFPAILGIVIKGYKDERDLKVRAATIALLAFLSAGLNYTYIAYLGIAVAIIIVYKLLFEGKKEFTKSMKLALYATGLSALTSIYVYGIAFYLFIVNPERTLTLLAAETPEWLNNYSSMVETLRQMGAVDMYYFFAGWTHPEWVIFREDPAMIMLSFVLPILAFSSLRLILRSDQNKNIILFIAMIDRKSVV